MGCSPRRSPWFCGRGDDVDDCPIECRRQELLAPPDKVYASAMKLVAAAEEVMIAQAARAAMDKNAAPPRSTAAPHTTPYPSCVKTRKTRVI